MVWVKGPTLGWSNNLQTFTKPVNADGTFRAAKITSVQILCLLNHFV